VSGDGNDPEMRRGRVFSGLLFVSVALILVRAAPLVLSYARQLGKHGSSVLLAAALAAAVALVLFTFALARWFRLTLTLVGAGALVLIVLSKNLLSTFVALAILALALLAGDAVSRLLRGREAGPGDLSSVFAAGAVTMGVVPLLLGEIGFLQPIGILAVSVLLLLLRWRRVGELARLLAQSIRMPQGSSPRLLEALWIAATIILIGAEWVGSLGPDLSWDGLEYHLPEALHAARTGRVDYLIDLVPQTYFWRNHETFLSLGFLLDGERTVRVLQFAVGMGVFAAALALARRVGAAGAAPLILLALASFPTGNLQMRATYVDWPAAFLLTAAAAEIAASREDSGRLRLAGFLFGGAVATKVFAILGAPALALLFWRRGGLEWRRLARITVGVLLALLPWFAWSQSRGGFFLAPYVRHVSFAAAAPTLDSTFHNEKKPPRFRHGASLRGFLFEPYELTFSPQYSEGNQAGYNGMIPLAILPGIFGWGVLGLLFYLLASIPAVAAWYLTYDPSVRYLIPIYPLYALFAVEGLRRLTRSFAGRWGALAGGALAAAALSFPVQFGSSGFEWKVAAGLVTWEQEPALRMPAYPLFRYIKPEDRVVFLGEHDRYHCPAGIVYRSAWYPVNRWGNDPDRWRQELTRYRITYIVHRDEAFDKVPVLEALRDRLVRVERSGVATLYRVLPENRETPAGPRPGSPGADRP
jgi:4-amino-4-deoxy-L-arabinose transferase-like glycosyltransferase